MSDAIDRIDRSIAKRSPLHVVTANMQFLGLAAHDSAFAALVADAGLVVGDGVPLLWLSRLQGHPIPQRITGHDLVHACAALAAQRGYSLGFLGGADGVGPAAARVLTRSHPGLRVTGAYDGRFSADGTGSSSSDQERLVQAIRRDRPDVLLVALGCPKQEWWIHRHIDAIDVPVCIGVGGVLDVLAGHRTRAPGWMQRAGLEWLHRFRQEPARLWRRYLVQDVPMLVGTGAAIGADRLRRWLASR